MRSLILCIFTLVPCLFAEGPEFEVASIKTGLTAKYDFFMEFAPPGGVGAATGADGTAALGPGVDLAGAVQQQLGLRLVKGKAMLEVVVVDKLEKRPTEN